MNQLASSQAQKHKLGWTVATCCTREHLGYLGFPTRHSVEQDAGMARSPGPGRNPGGQDLDHRAASARSWSFVVGVDHLHLLTGKLIQNSRGSPAPVHAVVGAPCAPHPPPPAQEALGPCSCLGLVPTYGPPKVKSEKAKGPRSEGGPWWREGPSSSVTG